MEMEKLNSFNKIGIFVLSKTTIFKANSKNLLMQGALPPCTPCTPASFVSLHSVIHPHPNSFRPPPQKWPSCAPVYICIPIIPITVTAYPLYRDVVSQHPNPFINSVIHPNIAVTPNFPIS